MRVRALVVSNTTGRLLDVFILGVLYTFIRLVPVIS